MPYEFYKILHFIGLIIGVCVVSAVIVQTWAQNSATIKGRKALMIVHGIAVLVMFVSGFGLLAKLGMISGWPTWVWVKLAGIAFLAVAPSLVLRIPATRTFMWWLFPLLLIGTAFSVVYKI